MSYDTWKATDAIGDADEAAHRLVQHADDMAREQEWMSFTRWLRATYGDGEWHEALWDIKDHMAYRDRHPMPFEMQQFFESYGWPAVLRAVALAMEREQ